MRSCCSRSRRGTRSGPGGQRWPDPAAPRNDRHGACGRLRQPTVMRAVLMYQWTVLLHVVGAFVFVLSHGAAVFVAYELPKQLDSGRIVALLDASATSL